eukprot:gene22994-30182_t
MGQGAMGSLRHRIPYAPEPLVCTVSQGPRAHLTGLLRPRPPNTGGQGGARGRGRGICLASHLALSRSATLRRFLLRYDEHSSDSVSSSQNLDLAESYYLSRSHVSHQRLFNFATSLQTPTLYLR